MYPGQPSSPPVSAKLMMVPLVRRRNGAAACAQKKGALRFVSSELSQISSVVETMLAGRKLAALLTRMSSRPNCFAASSKRRLMSETLVRSAAIAVPRRPSFSISATADCASNVEERWWMITSAPSSARRSATARPKRFADPVTRATRPTKDSPLFTDDMTENDTIAHEAAGPPRRFANRRPLSIARR